jgi:hypothetical protein
MRGTVEWRQREQAVDHKTVAKLHKELRFESSNLHGEHSVRQGCGSVKLLEDSKLHHA